MLTIEKLVARLKRLDTAYYEDNSPKVSDAAYDLLKEELREQAPKHEYLKRIGSPVQHGVKTQLPISMGSLRKIRPSEAALWAGNIPHSANGQVCITPKLDGIAGLLHYKDGRLHASYTRGDGLIGRNITENARCVQGVPLRLNNPAHYKHFLEGDTFFKCEFIIHTSIFDEKYKRQALPNGKEYSAARNFCGGMLNTTPRNGVDKATKACLKDMTAVCFSLSQIVKGKEKRHAFRYQELLAISELGMTAIDNPTRYREAHSRWKKELKAGKLSPSMRNYLPIRDSAVIKTMYSVKELDEDLIKDILSVNGKLLDIAQDGLVIEPQDVKIMLKLGSESDNLTLKGMKAIKLDREDQESQIGIIKEIDILTSKRRLLKPTLVLKEPLDFNGALVDRCTLHNMKTVYDNGLGPGAKVEIIRSGDVIPYYKRTVKAVKPLEIKNCPACFSPVKWTKTKTDLVCQNPACEGAEQQVLQTFFNLLKVDGFAGTSIATLAEDGYDTLPKLLSLTPKKLRDIGWGKVISKKVGEGIQNVCQNIPLATLAHATSCFSSESASLGSTRLQAILDVIGEKGFFKYSDAESRKALANVQGIGETSLVLFLQGRKRFLKLWPGIEPYVTLARPFVASSSSMKEVIACFTGYRSSEQEKMILQNGGKVKSSLTKDVNVLFFAQASGTKWNKAQASNIETVAEADASAWLEKRMG